jgi:hypothetical protein
VLKNTTETIREAVSAFWKTHAIWRIVGVVLLVFWAAVWAVSARKNHLVIGPYTYVPSPPSLGCDFDINYYAARFRSAGGDPYQGFFKGPDCFWFYDHPPLVLALFAWCNLLPHSMALILWLFVQTAVFSLAVFLCWRSRKELGLCPIPLPLLLAAALFSYPVLCEMQQGNWNMLVLLFLILTVWSLHGRSLWHDVSAGAFAGIAAWIKIYPALLLLGLLALRRWRAACCFGIAVLSIGLADVPQALEFTANIKETAKQTPDFFGSFSPWSHTVSGSWALFCRSIHFQWLGRLPGTIGWGLLVFPLVLGVSFWVATVADPSRLLYPYFLWLTASATYLPPVANDYSLFFLPLAALTVWDRRDKALVHVLMAVLLLWWQPIWMLISAKFLWYCKLISLGSVGLVLLLRAGEQNGEAEAEDEHSRRWVVA